MDFNQYRRNVCLLGSGPHWPNAPFAEERCEIWSLGALWRMAPRITRFFELHPFDRRRQHTPEIVEWMQENARQGMQVVCQRSEADIPNCMVYPLAAIKERFGTYLRSSMDLMLCMYYLEIEASEWDYSDCYLTIHGVDMAANDEYAYQKPSFESWIKYGEGKGLHVDIPPECDLFKCRGIYGYEVNAEFGYRVRAKENELKDRIMRHEGMMEQAKMAAHIAAGAKGAFTKLRESMNGTFPKELDEEEEKIMKALQEAKAEADAQLKNVDKLKGGLELIPWLQQYS